MEQSPQTKTAKNINKLKHIFDYVIKVRWFISALIALSFFFFLKRFVIDIVRVNNHDMEANYTKGDALLVKKMFTSYSITDLVYFEYPVQDSLLKHTYFIQRLYGLPGDSVELKEKQIYLNGMRLEADANIKHNYFIKTHKIKLDSAFKEKYHLQEGGEISIDFDYSFSLTQSESEVLKKDSLIKSVELKLEKAQNYDETCYPFDPLFKWNMDFYGKLYIPKRGDSLDLDSMSLKLYLPIITNYEKNTFLRSHDSVFINGIYALKYLVKKNYYFVLGDNRDNANDSRVWGFLPENFIKGKVIGRIRKTK